MTSLYCELRDEQTEEYYKMRFNYNRIGFLTKQEYEILQQADEDISTVSLETCAYIQKLIQDNYAAYYIASASLPGKLRMRLSGSSTKSRTTLVPEVPLYLHWVSKPCSACPNS